MDFWQSIVSGASDLVEDVTEGIGDYTGGWFDIQKQRLYEKLGDPEFQRANEPIKGANLSGQPIVATGQTPEQGGAFGMSKEVLYIAGAAGFALVALIALKK